MIATNHALTGAAIGLTVSNPFIALLVAFMSHFVLDALPHFGFTDLKRRDRVFSAMLAADITFCFILVIVLMFTTSNWFVVSLAAFLATSPDAMWGPDYIRTIRKRAAKGITNKWMRFHSEIQWYQKPLGGIIEVGYFVLFATIVRNLL